MDTTNTVIEHNMLDAHPLYVLAIAVVVIALFALVAWINHRQHTTREEGPR